MRIAVVFDCLYPNTTGGGEKYYTQLARAFRRAGHVVDYLTRQQWRGPAPQPEGVRVVAIAGDLPLYDAAGVRRPDAAVRFAAALGRHLAARRGHYDAVVVSATPVLNVFAARAALAGTRTRLLVDWLEIWTRDQWLAYSGPVVGRAADALQRWAVRLSPLASGHGRHTRAGALRNGLPAARFLLVPGLIDDVREVSPRLTFDEEPMVLFAGRHIADKNVDALPAALAALRRDLPGVRAVITGAGPETAAIRRELQRCGVADVVDLPGFVSADELDALMRQALCLVNPSRREGYGLVVVEAAAHGTPVVLVDHPTNAAVELIKPGVNGFVAATASAADLAAAFAAVHRGGAALRASTRQWYADAVRTRTVTLTAAAMLDRLAP